MADTSIRSNLSALSRLARPESGRLHRKYPYRWLFDQVHVKSLIFHVEVALLAAAVVCLYRVSLTVDDDFEPFPIPGVDGLLWNGDKPKFFNKTQERTHLHSTRDSLNIFSYFLIFSVICGFCGMRLSETSAARRNFPTHVNPALLLIPTAISVIVFLYPLFLWTLRTLRSTIIFLINRNIQIRIVLDCFRMSMLPIIIIWALYIYFLYGFCLGLMYYQRRGDQPTPTSHNNPFRRPLRKPSQHIALRLQGKGCSNLVSDLTAIVTNEHSTASTSHCAAPPTSSSARHNRSTSPRSFRQLETVDEEAQSRSSSE